MPQDNDGSAKIQEHMTQQGCEILKSTRPSSLTSRLSGWLGRKSFLFGLPNSDILSFIFTLLVVVFAILTQWELATMSFFLTLLLLNNTQMLEFEDRLRKMSEQAQDENFKEIQFANQESQQKISLLESRFSRLAIELNPTKVCPEVMRGRTYELFTELTRTGPIFAIEEAIERCWRLHDWGRIPLFKDVIFRIIINNKQDVVRPNLTAWSGGEKELSDWRWLRIDFCMQHALDLELRNPLINERKRRKQPGNDFFEISGQSCAQLIEQIVAPIAVMSFDDYAREREIWDTGAVTVAYPLTDFLRRMLVANPTNKSEMAKARSLPWIQGVSRHMQKKIGEGAPNNGNIVTLLEGYEEGPCSLICLGENRRDRFLQIRYYSVFQEDGQINREVWEGYKKNASPKPTLVAWVEDPPSTKDRALVGLYLPDFAFDEQKRDDLGANNLHAAELQNAELFHCLSYLNIEEARKGDHVFYRQSAYDFAVGRTAKFDKAEIDLIGDMNFESDPAVALYSLHAYAPHQSISKPVKSFLVDIKQPDGRKEDVTFYPSDSFSIRWSRRWNDVLGHNLGEKQIRVSKVNRAREKI